jgi:hypothetical protein
MLEQSSLYDQKTATHVAPRHLSLSDWARPPRLNAPLTSATLLPFADQRRPSRMHDEAL